ncbi:MAG TPA: hypothetical protein VM324_04295 [Egibacteraceae bacterium]|nr:hypothetical protein [Egibacteraceae bacterium]
MSRERGGAAVEFALALPIVLGIVGMVVTGALAFTMNALLLRGAEHATRVAAVPTDLATRTYATDAQVAQAAADGAILFIPTAVQRVCSPSPCRGGGRVGVTVSYVWTNPAAGLLSAMTGGGFGGSYTFTTTTRRVVE